ncbi:MAG: permease, partial [bacterium]
DDAEKVVGNESESSAKCCCHDTDCDSTVPQFPIGLKKKLIGGLRYAFIDLMSDTAKWFVLGILIAGVITYFVPTSWIDKYLSNTLVSMLVMALIGVPLFVCSSCSTPITAALILKGINPGAALVFLLTGPATNAAAIPLLTRYFGKKSTIIYLISIAGCAIVFGLILNAVYLWLGITPKAIVGKVGSIFPAGIRIFSAILLLLLMVNSWKSGSKTCK